MNSTIYPALPAILSAIGQANTDGLIEHERSQLALSVLRGLSGRKIIGALQRLCRLFPADGSVCYLEVGVFQGLTLNHVAAANPELPCYGIDNFAYFDPDKKNLGVVERGIQQLANRNASLINADYEDALENLGAWIRDRRIAVYFIDGPHDYRSQIMAIELAMPHLHERAVVVIDDSNYEHVRQANADFLRTHRDWALMAEAYTPAHPGNLPADEARVAEAGWWNGVNILARDPLGLVERTYPCTRRNRALFEADHLIHAHKMAHVAYDMLGLWDEIVGFAPLRATKRFLRLIKQMVRADMSCANFSELNTYSNELTAFKESKMLELDVGGR